MLDDTLSVIPGIEQSNVLGIIKLTKLAIVLHGFVFRFSTATTVGHLCWS